MSLHARVIVADPPWSFRDALPGEGRGAVKHYKTMSVSDIMRYQPMPPIQENAILFLWRVASMPLEALKVCEAWGFCPKAEIVWVKECENGNDAFGMGHYTRGAHETCIIATRGSFKVASRSVRSVFRAPLGEHSEKPDAFFALVEELCGEGPFVELFARKARLNWHCMGDELPGEYVWTPLPAAAAVGPELKKFDIAISPETLHAPVASLVESQAKAMDEVFDAAAPKKRGRPRKASGGASTPDERASAESPKMPACGPEVAGANSNGRTPASLQDRVNELGEHPSLVDSKRKAMLVQRARAEKLITDDTLSVDMAWIKLQYAAPPGWFKQQVAPMENPSTLVTELAAKGYETTLINVAGWSVMQRDLARAWLQQGGDKPEFMDWYKGKDVGDAPPPVAREEAVMPTPIPPPQTFDTSTVSTSKNLFDL